MNDGLKPRYRDAILESLTRNPRVEQVVLFGSRANGKHTSGSDIDLCLVGDALTLDDLSKLAVDLEHLTVPQKVDLVLYHQISNEPLHAEIDHHGVVWFDRQQDAAHQGVGRP